MGWRFVSEAQVTELRELLMSHRVTPSDLLAVIGIDADTIAQHREEALRTALELWEGEDADEPLPTLDPELESYLSYEHLAPLILSEVQGLNWVSTEKRHFEVVLPGEPKITVSSHGLVPWMLPWKVTAGAESWEIADPAISRALLPLADPQGWSARLLDGTGYWSTGFWRERTFWRRFVGEPVSRAELVLIAQVARFEGYPDFSPRFRIRYVTTRSDDRGLVDSILSEISARGTALIDYVSWANLLDELGQPTSNWSDFLALYDRATIAVARQGWLEAWKQAAPGRTIELLAVGSRGTSEKMVERVMPSWRDAGFAGEPGYRIDLRRGLRPCGTVYLSDTQGGALIETAESGERMHWFDELDFSLLSFQSKGKPPTYGRVDANGKLELRHPPSGR